MAGDIAVVVVVVMVALAETTPQLGPQSIKISPIVTGHRNIRTFIKHHLLRDPGAYMACVESPPAAAETPRPIQQSRN